MMSLNQVLLATGLVRPAHRRGFCPACQVASGEDAAPDSLELSQPALAVAATLVAAGGGWVYTIAQAGSMGGMALGLGPVDSFAVVWLAMMAAMMLPTAIPLIHAFARGVESRPGWPVATALLALVYLAVWLAFGLACYAVYTAIEMPWPNQGLVGGVALVLAGLYALTPIKRASQTQCRELRALVSPLPFNLMRGAVVSGVRYGMSCIGCSAGLMIAMVLIGMANLLVAVVLAGIVLVHKLAQPTWRYDLALSLGVAAGGIAYAVLA
jgi:predicted metal-binding membrane protein